MLDIRGHIARAIGERRPVVALESSVIAHGLPWPTNLQTARAVESVIGAEGAVPATIAVLDGRIVIGAADAELERLARQPGVGKLTRRDLAVAIALKRTGATTVAATMHVARLAGIAVFATGGIGGVHRGVAQTGDVSADLCELSLTPVAVVCSGAKTILDLPRTLEALETYGVPVVGYRTDQFPGFYVADSGLPVQTRLNEISDVARFLRAHWDLQGSGVVIAQPPPDNLALEATSLESAIQVAEGEAAEQRIMGPALTPFLLGRLAARSQGRTVELNRELLVANAQLGARLAKELSAIN